ncbi:MAG: acetyl-CoA carboxylase biotin carboxyl carrier protein [Prochloraceae cyanobacterium]
MSIDFNEIRQLIAEIATTDITELILKSEDFELIVRKEITVIDREIVTPVDRETVKEAIAIPNKSLDNKQREAVSPPSKDKQWLEITSPMVGTFYRAPAPDESPFVDIGDRVSTGQTVCIIEAMKLMNEIETEIAGEIVEIAVENGQPVEYGQTLMWINPG